MLLLHPLIGLGLFCAILALSLGLHMLILKARGHRRPVFGAVQQARLHLPHSVILGILLVQPVLVLLLALVAVRYAGGHLSPAGAMARHRIHLAGGAAGTASVAPYAPPIRNQGSTESCAGQSTTTALMIESREMGKSFPYANFSGYYPWDFATGGQNVGTTLDAVALSEGEHGLVRESRWQVVGLPPASVQAVAYRPGASYRYLDGSEQQARIALQMGYAPILLVQLRSNFYNAFGVQTTDLYGSGNYGNHFITLLAISPNGDFEVQNSWGAAWGNGGRAWLPASSWSQLLAVGLVAPGANTAWPNLHRIAPIKPQPKPKPTATPRPVVKSHALRYRVITRSTMHPLPQKNPSGKYVLKKGWEANRDSALPNRNGFIGVVALDHKHRGYIPAKNLRAER